MLRLLWATGWLLSFSGLILQIYIRTYPLIHSGCQWPDGCDVKVLAYGDPQISGYSATQSARKRLDIYGNDLFLKQISSTTRNWLKPDYVAVMGDLLSSQWIPTDEFYMRADRFSSIFPADQAGSIVNISGNHDIGYHGEFTEERVNRFEEKFGSLNYIVSQFDDYRIVVLNSLSLDGPPYDDEPQIKTKEFIDSLRGFKGSTLLLMHIPLYKEAGICTDGPRFEYYEEMYGSVLKQQNHLSEEASNLILDSVFGDGKGGLIAAGHDHIGCFARYSKTDNGQWVSSKDSLAENLDVRSEEIKSIENELLVKEFTVSSIMGEYGGNTGLIWRENSTYGEPVWNYSLCRFHVQHIWWITQVLSLLGVLTLSTAFTSRR